MYEYIKLFGESKNDKSIICMHGEYESTNSMVVVLKDKPIIYFTGCPNSCNSTYIRYVFGEDLVYPIMNENNQETCDF